MMSDIIKQMTEDKISAGNVLLYTKSTPDTSVKYMEPMTISFGNGIGGEPILKLCDGGDIYVNGRLAASDLEVVDAMKTFLSLHTNHFSDKGRY